MTNAIRVILQIQQFQKCNKIVMLIERSQSRKRKYSSSTKTKFEFQLPKINKTTLLLKDKQKQNQSVIASTFAERVCWVIETKDYTTLSERQIEQEYSKLRKQLHNINLEVQKAIEKMDVRLLRKSKVTEHDTVKTLQISDKEVENNTAIIDRLRKQHLQLQKRLSMVTTNSKDDVEQQIEKTKGDIDKCKLKIKELKMKNKNIGDSIMGSDDLFQQIKRLQNEKQVNQRKKMKLQTKTDHVYDQISTSQLRLEEIGDNFLIAQNFFHEYYDKSNQSSQQKEMQIKLQHAKHCLEIVSRKNETSTNLKQQKYHILLKNLEGEVNKLNVVQQKTASIQLQIIHCKKVILELEALYKQNQIKKQILNQQPVFFTQFEGDIAQVREQVHGGNDKNGQDTRKKNDQVIEKKNNEKQIREQIQQINLQKKKAKERLSTNNLQELAEQQDIICELDEKFKYKTKQNLQSTRYEKETQIGEDLPEDMMDDDEQDKEIQQFKSKISEQKVKRKSKEGLNIMGDLDKIKSKIDKFDFMKANDDSYD